MLGLEEVGSPLPNVPRHVTKAIAVGRERADGRGALVAGSAEVLPGELALPGVRHEAATRSEFIAPHEPRTLQPTARGVLPLGFGRQRLTGPAGVGFRVLERDVRDRMVLASVERTGRTLGPVPARAGDVGPPLSV